MVDPKEAFREILAQGARAVAPAVQDISVHVERPKDPAHGDFSSNIALQLSKRLRRNPRDIAQLFVDATTGAVRESEIVESLTIAGAGFLNARFRAGVKLQIISRVLEEGPRFGCARAPSPQKIQVEFVSANPTGPLHVGHGRQAALGDALCSLLQSQGHSVAREFYYNDAGAQIEKLAASVQARARGLKPGDPGWPDEAYNGEYIQDIALDYLAAGESIENADAVRNFAVAYLRAEQDADLLAFGVSFDHFYLESSLYAEGKVEETVKGLLASGKAYEKDGALWLRTTDYGDDKDRVVRKTDGSYTYFVPDVAYHVTKWQRGYTKAINVQGTDHHSTITRVRAGLQALALGIPRGYPDYVLHSLVKVMRAGEEVKISKRAGDYVTLRDLIDWVGWL